MNYDKLGIELWNYTDWTSKYVIHSYTDFPEECKTRESVWASGVCNICINIIIKQSTMNETSIRIQRNINNITVEHLQINDSLRRVTEICFSSYKETQEIERWIEFVLWDVLSWYSRSCLRDPTSTCFCSFLFPKWKMISSCQRRRLKVLNKLNEF